MKQPLWIDESRLKDPMFWFMKAWHFASAAQYIMNDHQNREEGSQPGHLDNAINVAPYLTGLALELFMKGYLVHKDVDPRSLRERTIGHDLKKLRQMCLKFGDKRFNNKELVFFTDKLGEQVMKDGGIRYPDKLGVPIYYQEFEISLKNLQEVARDISNKLVKWGSVAQ